MPEGTEMTDNYYEEQKKIDAERRAFAASLKPGDVITYVYRTQWHGNQVATLTFERETATQLVFKGNARYRKDTLSRVGGTYFDTLPLPATAEEIKEVREGQEQRRLASDLGSVDFRKHDLETLRSIKALLNPRGPR